MAELDVDIQGRVASLTLNRPAARNALSTEVLDGLIAACGELAGRDDVHLVVLRGSGGTFSAGADLLSFMAAVQAGDAEAAADQGRRAADAIEALPQLTLALIEGWCIGGGVVLSSACDVRWCTPDARFSLPELALGAPLAWGGLPRLARLVGEGRAVDLVLTCRRFTAEDALAWGFVSQVFPTLAEAPVGSLAALPAAAARFTKRQLTELRAGRFDPGVEARGLLASLADPESQAAAQRYFAEKFGR